MTAEPNPLIELSAKHAITEVLHRYCRAMDRVDRALARTCWHEGATIDYEGAFRGLATDFVDWVCTLHEQLFIAHSHQVTNTLITLDGARATSECYVTVALRSKGPAADSTDIEGRGRYLDRWARRDGVWAVEHRRHISDLRTVRPAIGAQPLGPSSRRDRSDPSYELLEVDRPTP